MQYERTAYQPQSTASLPSTGLHASTYPSRGTDALAQWSSRQLLAGKREIEIAHAGSVYRLRLTSLGKLILTK